MKTTFLLGVGVAGALSASCNKEESNKSLQPKAEATSGDLKATPPSTTSGAKGVARLFAGEKPSLASAHMPEIELGMKLEDANALWEKDKGAFKTENFKLTFIASDDKTVDMIQYVGLPKDGVIEAGDKAWGPSTLDPAANDPEFPRKRSCWFNVDDGIRACARYDERMNWTALTVDHYLAAESFIKDGLFVFERGASLIGMNHEALTNQLVRFDDWPHRKDAFIPPTDFEETNMLKFEFSEDGNVTGMHFSLRYTDDAHKERYLAALTTGLGEATSGEEAWTYSAAGRTVQATLMNNRIAVSVK